MNRYQIYLDPQDVAGLDRLASDMDLNRSHIIRDVVSRVMREYEKVLTVVSRIRAKDDPLLKMAGMIKTGNKNLSQDVDSIYFQD